MFELIKEIVKKQNQIRKIDNNLLRNTSLIEAGIASERNDTIYYLLRDIIFLVEKAKKDFNKLNYKDKANLYFELSENYCSYAFILCSRKGIDYKLVNEEYDFDDDQIETIKESSIYLNESLTYLNYLFENYDRVCGERLDAAFDSIYSSIAMNYLLLRDFENYEKTLIKGLDYSSLECSIAIVDFYVNNMEYLKALNYYDTFYSLISRKYKDAHQDFKIEGIFILLTTGLIDRGYYTNAELICEDAIKYYKSNPVDIQKFVNFYGKELDEEFYNQAHIDELICDFENKIKECKSKTNELSNIKLNNNILEEKFDDKIIKLMDDDVKVYINTSLGIYDMIEKNDSITFDYSSCLMPIMKAVESILFKIIGDNYLEFLRLKIRNKEYLDLSYVDNHLKYNEPGGTHMKKYIDFLEYGTVLHSIADKYYAAGNSIIIKPNKYFTEFCLTAGIESPKDIIVDFYNKLSVIREKRNKVAHRKRVTENDAKITYDYLIDNFKFIQFLYTNFEFCFYK